MQVVSARTEVVVDEDGIGFMVRGKLLRNLLGGTA